jgi:hypothetical protein
MNLNDRVRELRELKGLPKSSKKTIEGFIKDLKDSIQIIEVKKISPFAAKIDKRSIHTVPNPYTNWKAFYRLFRKRGWTKSDILNSLLELYPRKRKYIMLFLYPRKGTKK